MATDEDTKYARWVERSVGAAVRSLRESRGLSQLAVADQLTAKGVPFHQTQIGKLETGTRPIRVHELYALADLFDVSAAEILASAGGIYSPNEDSRSLPDQLAEEEREMRKAREALDEALIEYTSRVKFYTRRRAAILRAMGPLDSDGE